MPLISAAISAMLVAGMNRPKRLMSAGGTALAVFAVSPPLLGISWSVSALAAGRLYDGVLVPEGTQCQMSFRTEYHRMKGLRLVRSPPSKVLINQCFADGSARRPVTIESRGLRCVARGGILVIQLAMKPLALRLIPMNPVRYGPSVLRLWRTGSHHHLPE